MRKLPDSKKGRRRDYFLEFAQNVSNVKRILMIRNGMLGDVTSITSVLNRLVNTYPGVAIDIITGPNAGSILLHFPGIADIYPFNFNFSILSIIKQIPFFRRFKKKRYDIVLVQEVNTHYTILSRLISPRFIAGFANRLSFLYDYSVERPKIPMALAEMETVREWTIEKSQDKSVLYVSNSELANSKNLLNSYGITAEEFLAILHPGSSGSNSDRQWVLERYAELAEELITEYNAKIIFTGVKHDEGTISHIQRLMKSQSVSVAGKTDIRTFLAIIKQAKIVIAPDTGIIHIAAALDTPTVMMMGLSDPNDTGPYNPNSRAKVARIDLPCSPCVARNPKPEQWELCENMRPVKCMSLLSTEIVMKVVRSVLNGKL